MKKLVPVVLSFAFAGMAFVGCSKTYTRDDVKATLTKSSVPPAMVDCITDKMIAKFGLDRMGQSGDLTPEESAAATQIGTECATAAAGISTTTAAP